jgi:hypothetical protein
LNVFSCREKREPLPSRALLAEEFGKRLFAAPRHWNDVIQEESPPRLETPPTILADVMELMMISWQPMKRDPSAAKSRDFQPKGKMLQWKEGSARSEPPPPAQE